MRNGNGTWPALAGAACLAALVAGCAHVPAGNRTGGGPSPEVSATGKVEFAAQYACATAPGLGYNTFEVYLENHTLEPVTFKTVDLDGVRLPEVNLLGAVAVLAGPEESTDEFPLSMPVLPQMKNVCWWQFYPSPRAESGRTVVLQVNLKETTMAGRRLVIADDRGRTLEVPIPPYRQPAKLIRAVTFEPGLGHIYVQVEGGAASLSRLRLNNADVPAFDMLRAAADARPKVLSLPAPFRIASGDALHVKVEFSDGSCRHALLKAMDGISLEAARVDADGKVARQFSLDPKPPCVMSPDVTCGDARIGGVKGGTAPVAVAARMQLRDQRPEALFGVSYCTAIYPELWNIYGQLGDAVYAKTYRFGWGHNVARHLEEEEADVEKARLSAAPRPFFWVPQRMGKVGTRHLEPEELDVLAWMALARGAKGIRYHFWMNGGPDPFARCPLLPQAMMDLDATIRKKEALLAPLLLESETTVDAGQGGKAKVYQAWSGTKGVLVMIRNLGYRTDAQPDNGGREPRFKAMPLEDVLVPADLPPWFKGSSAEDFLTGEKVELVAGRGAGKNLRLPRLGAYKLVWLPNS